MISFNSTKRTFYLQGANISYIFAADDYGHLRHLYFGERLPEDEDLSFSFRDEDRGFSGNFAGAKDRTASLDTAFLEYPSAGMGDYRRPALLLLTQDGARQADLRYVSHTVHRKKPVLEGLPHVCGGETLEVLQPGCEPFSVTLDKLYDENMEPISAAPHATMRVLAPCSRPIETGAYLRRKTT